MTCTRRLEFDAAHRITRHGSKCRHLHGHRYVVEVTCRAGLDGLGMVVDFGDVKRILGEWLDTHLDHGAILNAADEQYLPAVRAAGHKLYVMPCEPTAENLALELLRVATGLLSSGRLGVVKVVVWETPNCRAEAVGATLDAPLGVVEGLR